MAASTAARLQTIYGANRSRSREPCAGGAHFVGGIPASPQSSRWSAQRFFPATNGSTHPKGIYTSRSDRPTRSGTGRQAMPFHREYFKRNKKHLCRRSSRETIARGILRQRCNLVWLSLRQSVKHAGNELEAVLLEADRRIVEVVIQRVDVQAEPLVDRKLQTSGHDRRVGVEVIP